MNPYYVMRVVRMNPYYVLHVLRMNPYYVIDTCQYLSEICFQQSVFFFKAA